MRVLFFSLLDIRCISDHGLYNDLLREFIRNHHEVTILSPVERKTGLPSEIIEQENARIIRVRVGNIQKTNYIEKAFSLLLLGHQLKRGLKKHCNDLSFDCLLYATPPITIYRMIKTLKWLTGAPTVLMLKDIWPQEIVDLGIISGKGLLYKYFKDAEKKLYSASDWIGYTSPASKRYLEEEGVEGNKLIPIHNSVDPNYQYTRINAQSDIRKTLGVSDDDLLLFYGGNLGKPQDIDFVIACLETQKNRYGVHFVLCGQGTEYKKLEVYFSKAKPTNMTLLPFLSKQEYDQLIMEADVGMVFLNHRFTVPNCPTRFYDYMQYGKPILACTDTASDIKDDILEGRFGWWCESLDSLEFKAIMEEIIEEGKDGLKKRGKLAREHLERFYTVDKDYQVIINAINVINRGMK